MPTVAGQIKLFICLTTGVKLFIDLRLKAYLGLYNSLPNPNKSTNNTETQKEIDLYFIAEGSGNGGM
jgi:hypothetical protein